MGLRLPKVEFTRGELLDLVLSFEHLLRQLVAHTLKAKYGDDWPNFLPSELKARLEMSRGQAAKQRWGPDRGTDVLNFASLGDLETIILGRWNLFEPIFQDKPVIRTKLMELRLHRNALAHGVEPSDEDKLRSLLIVRDLQERVPTVLLYAMDEGEPAPPTEAENGAQAREASASPRSSRSRIRAKWIHEVANRLAERDDLELVANDRRDTLPTFVVRSNRRVIGWVKVGQTSIAVIERGRRVGARVAEINSPDELSSLERAIQSLKGAQ